MESKRLEQEKMEEETLRGAFDETCCSGATRTGLMSWSLARATSPEPRRSACPGASLGLRRSLARASLECMSATGFQSWSFAGVHVAGASLESFAGVHVRHWSTFAGVHVRTPRGLARASQIPTIGMAAKGNGGQKIGQKIMCMAARRSVLSRTQVLSRITIQQKCCAPIALFKQEVRVLSWRWY